MSIVVVGGTVMDIIVARAPRLPTWPRHSEFTPANLVLLADAPLVTLGGNGANAAYVAACSGARVDLSTNMGDDPFGTVARGWVTASGCRLLQSKKTHRTAINFTAANARHARATFFYPGTPPELPALRDLPLETTHLLVCGWPHPPLLRLDRCFRSLRGKGIFTALDTGPFLERPWTLRELKPLLASLHLLLTNEYELNALTRSAGLSMSLRKLRRHFQGHVVVKRGSRGALWLPESSCEPHIIRPPKVQAVNTVGAGDSFNGALLAALDLKREFEQALAHAAKISARVVASKHGILGVTHR
jgi:sugar/nucleoside kinase (ribokinase family)